MIALGMPYINGYKPLGNYQNLLFETVSELISSNPRIQEKLDIVVNSDVVIPSVENILSAMVSPPEPRLRVQTARTEPRMVHFEQVNYLKRESQNQQLGLAGELLSNLVYGVSSGVPVWLICCPYTVFENDTFDNFADKIETLDTLPPLFS